MALKIMGLKGPACQKWMTPTAIMISRNLEKYPRTKSCGAG
jgi:hypothetical protein